MIKDSIKEQVPSREIPPNKEKVVYKEEQLEMRPNKQ